MYCSYFSLAVAIVVTVLVRLQYDVGTVELLSPPCNTSWASRLGRVDSPPVPVGPCVAPGLEGGVSVKGRAGGGPGLVVVVWGWGGVGGGEGGLGCSHRPPLVSTDMWIVRPCCTLGCAGNSTVWNGTVTNVNKLSGDVTLSLFLAPLPKPPGDASVGQ